MKRIIIIIMIIVISLTIVIMPIRNPFGWDNRYIPLTDVSAEEMGIGVYTPAFIAWLITMLASMGVNISSLSEFEELLQQSQFNGYVSGAFDYYTGTTAMERAGMMTALSWNYFRDLIRDWTESDEAELLKSNDLSEYLQQLSTSGAKFKEWNGQKLWLVGSSNLLTTINYDSMTADDLNEFITYAALREDIEPYRLQNYDNYAYFEWGSYKANNHCTTCKIWFYNPVTEVKTHHIDFWTYPHLPINRGWVYYLKTSNNYDPDINGNVGIIYAMPFVVAKREGQADFKKIYKEEVVVEHLSNNTLNIPQIKTGTKLSIPVDDTYIGENDIVSFDWDAQVEQDIALAIAGSIPMDLDLPQEVAVTTNNPVITNVIYNTVTIPVEDIDFPDIDNFKIPTGITTKFPFSIPFDVYRAFQMLEATPEIPHWEIPIRVENIVDETIVIDLEDYQGLINIVRWFLLAIFILGLILATRGLIKG